MNDTVTIEYVRTRIKTMIAELKKLESETDEQSKRAIANNSTLPVFFTGGMAAAYTVSIDNLIQWLTDLDKLEPHNDGLNQSWNCLQALLPTEED